MRMVGDRLLETTLVLDPGDVTGWSFWGMDDETPITRLEFGVVPGGLDGFLEWISITLHRLRPDNTICEKFDLNGSVKDPPLSAVQIEGALAMALYQMGEPQPYWQEAADFKPQVRDSILKENELWLTGSQVDWEDGRDVNDTAIHALAWAKTQEHYPTLEKYWPDN